MMIVKERSWTAVLAAFAWVALVYLWQAGSLEGYSASIDSPEASHSEARATFLRTAELPRD